MNYKDLRALLLRRFSIPKEYSVRKTIRSFTIAEKAVLFFFVTVFILSGTILLWQVNSAYLVEVPTRGGTLTEGIVGNPRFINPVLAISEADRNLSSLVYSGLIRVTLDGKIKNDLADEITISADHLTYTVSIRPDARFHDGTPVSADDIIFTLQKVADPLIKSPKRGSWDGVRFDKVNDWTVAFTLKQAYTPFIYNLTTGILPKEIWKNVSDDEFSFSQFNTLPIGSGPYKVERVERNSGGIPDFYELSPFDNGDLQGAFIAHLIFRFYPSESVLIEAYNTHEVESLSGISPEKLLELKTNGSQVISSPLPRVFAVFFNQNQSKVLANKEVRKALNVTSPKEEIVKKLLGGYATAINSPLPAGVYSWTSEGTSTPSDVSLDKAREILTKAGWVLNPDTGLLEKKSGTGKISLSFAISTGDAPELQAVASTLASTWEKLGAKVDVLVHETGDLNQNVIRPRNFDALLFGEVIGRNTDLYPFWHSSQRTDPGLNIALYTNNRADKFLEEVRSADDFEVIEESNKAFVEELKTDLPAIFLYTPSFLYVVPKKIQNMEIKSLSVSQDRFLGIRDWYIETDRIWKIFNTQ